MPCLLRTDKTVVDGNVAQLALPIALAIKFLTKQQLVRVPIAEISLDAF
jgi:hypothetical protein